MWDETGVLRKTDKCLISVTLCLLLADQSQRGSLFTLFLYCPLLAFLSVCGLSSLRQGLWEKAEEFLCKVFRDIGQMITRSRAIGTSCLVNSVIRFVILSANVTTITVEFLLHRPSIFTVLRWRVPSIVTDPLCVLLGYTENAQALPGKSVLLCLWYLVTSPIVIHISHSYSQKLWSFGGKCNIRLSLSAFCRSPGASQNRTLSYLNRTRWRAASCGSTSWSCPPCWMCSASFGTERWTWTTDF